MTDLPEPLTPPDCDLRHYDWMPLTITVLKGSRAWLRCKRNPALAFYFVNLWTAAWHQVPAASLEDDDEYLCDLAQCDEKTWAKCKEVIMSGFVKCSDGRLYHQYVAREANKSWQLYLAQRSRTEAATAARRAKQNNVASSSTPPTSNVTNNVTSDVTLNATSDATLPPSEPLRSPHTRPTRPTNLKEERTVPSERATAAPSPPDPLDARTEFWREGLAIVRSLTGRPDGASRRSWVAS